MYGRGPGKIRGALPRVRNTVVAQEKRICTYARMAWLLQHFLVLKGWVPSWWQLTTRDECVVQVAEADGAAAQTVSAVSE